jgi:serine/threonine-protein kinase RsbW
MGMLRVSVTNRMEEIRRVNAAVGNFLSEEGVPDRTVHHVRLVIEELVSNVVRYGFDDAGPHHIDVDVRTGAHHIAVTVEDSGRPFNPNDAPPPPTVQEHVEARRYGGLGIFLVKKLTRELVYSRENNRNRVRAILERVTR